MASDALNKGEKLVHEGNHQVEEAVSKGKTEAKKMAADTKNAAGKL